MEKLLIFIVAYNSGERLINVIERIPVELFSHYDVKVLVIDDCSSDNTYEIVRGWIRYENIPFEIQVLQNPVNQGYGGNQKLGYHYAEKHCFDYVALLHGDGQYAPEVLPELADALSSNNKISAVMGSRMLTKGGALGGGMPLYKYTGNKILTYYQNKMIGTKLSEFHSGYRIYRVKDLSLIKYDLNTNEFHFDTEILIQLHAIGKSILEIPIPTYYGDEICHVNGMKYAFDVFKTTLKYKMQRFNLLYDRKYDKNDDQSDDNYIGKRDFLSPHQFAVKYMDKIEGDKILDIGCASGYVGRDLVKKGAVVVGIDKLDPGGDGLRCYDSFIQYDLNSTGSFPISISKFKYVLLLDIIEHLNNPEQFMQRLRESIVKGNENSEIIISTGNVGFVIIRIMLALGQFNYGKKGILDLSHTRLFTFRTMKWLLKQNGFDLIKVVGIPAPFPLVIKNNILSKMLLLFNRLFIKVSKTLFSYQMVYVAKPLPTLENLLDETEVHSSKSTSH